MLSFFFHLSFARSHTPAHKSKHQVIHIVINTGPIGLALANGTSNALAIHGMQSTYSEAEVFEWLMMFIWYQMVITLHARVRH